jgi:hypothetical protein
MITSSTFIPNTHIYDLLCALWAEYRVGGNTRVFLMALRAELGAEEYSRFERDLARLLEKRTACFSIQMILAAAIRRLHEQSAAATFALSMHERRKRTLRTTYQPV